MQSESRPTIIVYEAEAKPIEAVLGQRHRVVAFQVDDHETRVEMERRGVVALLGNDMAVISVYTRQAMAFRDQAQAAANDVDAARIAAEGARDQAEAYRDETHVLRGETAADRAAVDLLASEVETDRAEVATNAAAVESDRQQVAAHRNAVAADATAVEADRVAVEAAVVSVEADRQEVAANTAQVATDTAAVAADRTAVAADLASVQNYTSQVTTMEANVAFMHGEVETYYAQGSIWHAEVEADRAEVAANTEAVEADKVATQGYRNEAEQFKLDAEQAAAAASGSLKPVDDWDASVGTNPPAPTDSTVPWYRISVAGVVPDIVSDRNPTGAVEKGDNIYWSAKKAKYVHIDNTERFTSINGYTAGAVNLNYEDVGAMPATATTSNIPEGTRLYHTSARVRDVTLAGLSEASSTKPSSIDTILSALGKIIAKLWNLTKSDVGLSNVDNVSAASLRDRSTHTGTQGISTVSGLQTALDEKADLNKGTPASMEINRESLAAGLYTYRIISSTTNKPSGLSYGAALNWGLGTGGSAQLVAGWTSGDQNFLAFRSLRDTTDNWWPIKRIYHEGYKPSWDDIGSKPTSFTPSAHTHPWSELTAVPATASRWPAWAEVTSKPSTFPPSAHDHHADYARIRSTKTALVSTSGWYTIAQSSGSRAYGEFIVGDSESGRHNGVKIIATAAHGQNSVLALAGVRFSTRTIAHVRVLYPTADRTYGGSKLQIYCENPSWTLRVLTLLADQVSGWTGWSEMTPVLENTPTGWAEDASTRFDDITNGRGVSGDGSGLRRLRWECIGENITNAWGGLRHQTQHGHIEFGPANTGYAHIYTDRPEFYFNKALKVNGVAVSLDGHTHTAAELPSNVAYGTVSTQYTGNTIAQRDASGDLEVRLLRPTYTVDAGDVFNYVMVQRTPGDGTDNYVRPAGWSSVVSKMASSLSSTFADHAYVDGKVSGTRGGWTIPSSSYFSGGSISTVRVGNLMHVCATVNKVASTASNQVWTGMSLPSSVRPSSKKTLALWITEYTYNGTTFPIDSSAGENKILLTINPDGTVRIVGVPHPYASGPYTGSITWEV